MWSDMCVTSSNIDLMLTEKCNDVTKKLNSRNTAKEYNLKVI